VVLVRCPKTQKATKNTWIVLVGQQRSSPLEGFFCTHKARSLLDHPGEMDLWVNKEATFRRGSLNYRYC